ncbi:MAG: TetR/AcrR family transcriptional regulator [Solirubrobacteraceae bacterium]
MAGQELTGTKAKIVEAALETLRVKGFAGASAREIARVGSFNQALIFYHFGSVNGVLLATLQLVSERRMLAYRAAFEQAQTISELAALAKRIHAEDLENGYVTVLGEMVAAGVADRELGGEVAACVEPWVELVERKLKALLGRSPLRFLVEPRDLAFAIVALYLGVDMLGHLEGSHARAESLLELMVSGAAIADAMLPPTGAHTR